MHGGKLRLQCVTVVCWEGGKEGEGEVVCGKGHWIEPSRHLAGTEQALAGTEPAPSRHLLRGGGS